MKLLCILVGLLVIAAVSAADETEPENLGIITPEVSVVLDSSTTRSDWSHFKLQFLGFDKLTFVTWTNTVLTYNDLLALEIPTNTRLEFFLRSVTTKGEEGEEARYLIEVRVAELPKPKARTTRFSPVGGIPNGGANRVSGLARSVPVPPLPPMSPPGTNLFPSGFIFEMPTRNMEMEYTPEMARRDREHQNRLRFSKENGMDITPAIKSSDKYRAAKAREEAARTTTSTPWDADLADLADPKPLRSAQDEYYQWQGRRNSRP